VLSIEFNLVVEGGGPVIGDEVKFAIGVEASKPLSCVDRLSIELARRKP
jgi:hypothetical protein